MNKQSTQVAELPVIDEFNGIIGFAQNIGGIMNMIAGTPSVDDMTLDQLVTNYDALVDIQTSIAGINKELTEVIANGSEDTELINQLININNAQSAELDEINGEIQDIDNMLNAYLPEIINMLEGISQQLVGISQQINQMMQMLNAISKQLNKIAANVALNSTIAEIEPHYQKIKYVITQFNELNDELVTAYSSQINNNKLHLGTDDIDTGALAAVIAWAKMVVAIDLNDLRLSLDAMNDAILGDNLYGNSALVSTADFYTANTTYAQSIYTSMYSYLSTLCGLQTNAYMLVDTARKILSLPEEDNQDLMNSRISQQKELFTSLSSGFSNVFYSTESIDMDPGASAPMNQSYEIDLVPPAGNALLGFNMTSEPDSNGDVQNGKLHVEYYYGKLLTNYGVDVASINVATAEFSMANYLPSSGIYNVPDGGLPTIDSNTIVVGFKLKITTDNMGQAFMVPSVVTAPYDSTKNGVGTTTKDVVIPQSDNNSITNQPMGIVSDQFLSPILNMTMGKDENGQYCFMVESALKNYVNATDMKDADTDLAVSPYYSTDTAE